MLTDPVGASLGEQGEQLLPQNFEIHGYDPRPKGHEKKELLQSTKPPRNYRLAMFFRYIFVLLLRFYFSTSLGSGLKYCFSTKPLEQGP